MNILNQLACNTGRICTQDIYKNSNMIVTSKIIDIDTGLPIPNVNVYLQSNPTIGTITNANGEFTLNVPENETVILSHVTYGKTPVSATDVLDIEYLQEQTNMLDEANLGIIPKTQQAGFSWWWLLILGGLYLGSKTQQKGKETVKATL